MGNGLPYGHDSVLAYEEYHMDFPMLSGLPYGHDSVLAYEEYHLDFLMLSGFFNEKMTSGNL